MKSFITKSVVVAALFALASPAFGQNNNQQGGLVAVLDVALVFKENATFNQRMDTIKSEAEAFKAQLQSQQQALQQKAEQLQDFKPGSAEAQSLESELAQQSATLQTSARQKENELMGREAKIYFDTYAQMKQAVSTISEQYGISLVLRWDSSEIDPENRSSVIAGVNRNVVYQHNLDLTTMVIEEMATISSAGLNNQIK